MTDNMRKVIDTLGDEITLYAILKGFTKQSQNHLAERIAEEYKISLDN